MRAVAALLTVLCHVLSLSLSKLMCRNIVLSQPSFHPLHYYLRGGKGGSDSRLQETLLAPAWSPTVPQYPNTPVPSAPVLSTQQTPSGLTKTARPRTTLSTLLAPEEPFVHYYPRVQGAPENPSFRFPETPDVCVIAFPPVIRIRSAEPHSL